MIEFCLHPQLKEDTHFLCGDDTLCCLLHKNALVPWFILVPKGEFTELDELDSVVCNRLFDSSRLLSGYLRTEFSAHKINIAALGNMVPQLHLHVIGRRKDDKCWPNPVWGYLRENRVWEVGQIQSIKNAVYQLLQH